MLRICGTLYSFICDVAATYGGNTIFHYLNGQCIIKPFNNSITLEIMLQLHAVYINGTFGALWFVGDFRKDGSKPIKWIYLCTKYNIHCSHDLKASLLCNDDAVAVYLLGCHRIITEQGILHLNQQPLKYYSFCCCLYSVLYNKRVCELFIHA